MTARRIIVPMAPDPALSPNTQVHWGTKARRAKEARVAAWAAGVESRNGWHTIDGSVTVKAIICWPKGRKRMDQDNAIACLKPYLDGLTDALVWGDDKQVVSVDVEQVSWGETDKAARMHYPAGVVMIDVEVSDGEV